MRSTFLGLFRVGLNPRLVRPAFSTASPSISYREPAEGVDTVAAVEELCRGSGYVHLPGLFGRRDLGEAREIIHKSVDQTRGGLKKATHFHGSEDARPDLQARTWDLVNKGQVFERMVQHPILLEIMREICGDDGQLGSIAANTLFPGATAQEPHLDYPYWDFYERKHWPWLPTSGERPFYLCFMATVMLDDFTENNGATAIVPYSSLNPEWPEHSSFYRQSVRITGKAGDVLLFVGTLQHASQANNSDATRTGILIQYLPKYIRPMEDQQRLLTDEVRERATPDLRRLLTLDYPYPAVMEKLEPGNSEGSQSDFKWK